MLSVCEGEKVQFSLLEFREEAESSAGVFRGRMGKMMWRKQYIQYAMSIEGGLKTEEQAEANWANWCPWS